MMEFISTALLLLREGLKSIRTFTSAFRQWDTVDAEVKVPAAEFPELSNILFLKSRVGQRWSCMYCTCCQEFLLLIVTFPVHSTSFFPNPLSTFLLLL